MENPKKPNLVSPQSNYFVIFLSNKALWLFYSNLLSLKLECSNVQ